VYFDFEPLVDLGWLAGQLAMNLTAPGRGIVKQVAAIDW
jgi:hypothetical protein